MLPKVVLMCALLFSRWLGPEAALLTTNIDTEEPTVILSPELMGGDDFGWAAVFHNLEPVSKNDSMEMSLANFKIVIGAPKGTYPGGLPLDDPGLPAAERSGLVYICPLGPGECEGAVGDTSLYIGEDINLNITNHLQDIDFDNVFSPELSEGRLFDQAPSTTTTSLPPLIEQEFDRKTGQLMGSFLASRGDFFLACASRWTSLNSAPNPTYTPRGICFVGNKTLQNFRTVLPCQYGLTSRNFFCSAGFSGVLLPNLVYLGAPGHSALEGRVYSQRPTGSRPTELRPPYAREDPGFFGSHITAGHITNIDQGQAETDIAVSAPRHGDLGGYFGRVFIYSTNRLRSTIRIVGTQTSEFFGYSTALIDITGDGYYELIVGAPMYTTLTPLMPEQGRIYVFFNLGRGNFDEANPVIFEGRGAYGRFGFSVANAGDLSGDGHEDLVVSAPYESMPGSSENTGVIYVYYGTDTSAAFRDQAPQRITASDIVNSVSSLDTLTSFGFTVSGGSDVDNNRHDDILVGCPDSQAVIVLRSLPFVNVTISLASSVEAINFDVDKGFTVTVTASYESLTDLNDFRIDFTLREIFRDGSDPRLFFAQNGNIFNGVYDFNGTRNVTVPVQVFAMGTANLLDDYQLRVDLLDISRDLPPVTGQQKVTSLNMFPRLRQQGNSIISVSVLDPCGTDGCMSDVELRSVPSLPQVLVAGSQNARELNFDFTNHGPEEARSVFVVISNITAEFFSSVSIAVNGSMPTSCMPTQFERDDVLASANCSIASRLASGQMGGAVLTFTLRDLVGDEADFNINLEIAVGDSQDVDTSNNRAIVQFQIKSQSSISLALRFDSTQVKYNSEHVMNPQVIESLGSLVSLTASVGNMGPSIIQEARLVIEFPARISDLTGSYYFLYPSSLGTIDEISDTTVSCAQTGLNPDSLTFNINSGRRRRSLPTRRVRQAFSKTAKSGFHRKRQAEDIFLDCSDPGATCVQFTCDIQRLTRRGVSIVLDSFTDGRFFSTSAHGQTFALIATGRVTVSGFQTDDDSNIGDNFAMAAITLVPDVLVAEEGSLNIHAIIWPTVFSGVVFVIGVIVTILCCVALFPRKKKPEKVGLDATAVNIASLQVSAIQQTNAYSTCYREITT